MKLPELAWIKWARTKVGTHEIKGVKHNPEIVKWLTDLKSWIKDDETPWCGTFVAAVCKANGLDYPKAYPSALAWNTYGTKLAKPAYGCIVVFKRDGGGHVGFVVGQDQRGNLMVLGGNQGDAVSIKPFSKARVVGYRWPSKAGVPHSPNPDRYDLPVLTSDGRLSTNEA